MSRDTLDVGYSWRTMRSAGDLLKFLPVMFSFSEGGRGSRRRARHDLQGCGARDKPRNPASVGVEFVGTDS